MHVVNSWFTIELWALCYTIMLALFYSGEDHCITMVFWVVVLPWQPVHNSNTMILPWQNHIIFMVNIIILPWFYNHNKIHGFTIIIVQQGYHGITMVFWVVELPQQPVYNGNTMIVSWCYHRIAMVNIIILPWLYNSKTTIVKPWFFASL